MINQSAQDDNQQGQPQQKQAPAAPPQGGAPQQDNKGLMMALLGRQGSAGAGAPSLSGPAVPQMPQQPYNPPAGGYQPGPDPMAGFLGGGVAGSTVPKMGYNDGQMGGGYGTPAQPVDWAQLLQQLGGNVGGGYTQ